MPHDFGLRHIRIMFQRQRRDRLVAFAAPADAAETHHRADVGAAFGQRSDFPPDVEIGFLDTDGDRDRHGRLQPPVIGGKKAISRAPAIAVSDLTWAWSIAARITRGVSKAWA